MCGGGGKGLLIQDNKSGTIATENNQFLCFCIGNGQAAGRNGVGFDGYNGSVTEDKAATLGVNCGMSSGRNGVISFDRAAFNQGSEAKYNFGIDENGHSFTVVARGPGGVCYEKEKTIIRRLTPTECARLQGFPDWWCADVPHSDSAEYKMWGNGVALPCVLYIMEGIAVALENNEKVTIKKSQQWKQLSFEELETEAKGWR